MDKKILMIIGAVLVIGGAGAYFLMGRGGGGLVSKSGIGGKAGPFSGTLKAAVALGVPMKCTYKMGDVEAEGYVKGEKYAGKMMMEGKLGHVIIKDNCMWSWEEGAAQGMKACSEETEVEEGEETGDVWSQAEADNQVEYKCNPAAVSDSVFEPPSEVEFLDLSEMMSPEYWEKMQEMGE